MAQWKQARFNTFDGLSLFYHYREPQRKTKDTLLLLHRGHEHSARMTSVGDDLSENDYWCFSFDLRGHGESDGLRAWAPGFTAWVKDLNSFSGHIRQQFGIDESDMCVVANSVSSTMLLSWVLNYGANIKGSILAAPAFSIKLYIPLALPALTLLSRFTTQQFVTSYVRPKLLTRDSNAAQAYADDPLITKKIGVNVLVGLFQESKRCFNRLADFETPVLLFSATDDHIVHNKQHYQFISRVSSKEKQHVVLQDFRHAIFFELEKHKFLEPSKRFIAELFSHERKQLPAVIPTEREHTRSEYTELLEKGSIGKQIYYSLSRRFLTRFGPLSDGVRLGLENGFDSGAMLDYVYKNQPSGKNIFGRLIDRVFLNSVGWRGIRIRKKHLKQTLHQLIVEQGETDVRPVVLDVACGAGRYLFELQQQFDGELTLHLNDIDERSLVAARNNQVAFAAPHTSFSQQDVFDLNASELIGSKANIIIISGLFELYDNNYHVHKALMHLYALLQDGGFLVYTGQPWHPQMEMIGRLLNNRIGKRWTMRRRIQTEMDQLVTSVGFDKLNTTSDELGIFTVSCARKVAHAA